MIDIKGNGYLHFFNKDKSRIKNVPFTNTITNELKNLIKYSCSQNADWGGRIVGGIRVIFSNSKQYFITQVHPGSWGGNLDDALRNIDTPSGKNLQAATVTQNANISIYTGNYNLTNLNWADGSAGVVVNSELMRNNTNSPHNLVHSFDGSANTTGIGREKTIVSFKSAQTDDWGEVDTGADAAILSPTTGFGEDLGYPTKLEFYYYLTAGAGSNMGSTSAWTKGAEVDLNQAANLSDGTNRALALDAGNTGRAHRVAYTDYASGEYDVGDGNFANQAYFDTNDILANITYNWEVSGYNHWEVARNVALGEDGSGGFAISKARIIYPQSAGDGVPYNVGNSDSTTTYPGTPAHDVIILLGDGSNGVPLGSAKYTSGKIFNTAMDKHLLAYQTGGAHIHYVNPAFDGGEPAGNWATGDKYEITWSWGS